MDDILSNSKIGFPCHRVFVVSEDVDLYNFNDVMSAYSTRCRPNMDEFFFDDVRGFPLVPYMSHGPGEHDRGGKCVSNCLLPIEYTDGPDFEVADFKHAYPKEIQRKVLESWTAIGFEE